MSIRYEFDANADGSIRIVYDESNRHIYKELADYNEKVDAELETAFDPQLVDPPVVGNYFHEYDIVGQEFRSGNVSKRSQAISDAITAAAGPLSQPMTVFRGMRGPLVKQMLADLKQGDTVPSYGPWSASLNAAHAADFAVDIEGPPKDASALFVIKLRKDDRVLLANAEEHEATVPEGFSLRVSKIHKDVPLEAFDFVSDGENMAQFLLRNGITPTVIEAELAINEATESNPNKEED